MTEKELLKQLERQLTRNYREVEKALDRKIKRLTADFDKNNKLYLEQIKVGKIDKKTYQKWYKEQVTQAKWCKDMIKEISKDITDANVVASKLINNDVSDVFLYGCLEASKEMEGLFNFEVIDTKQVEQILNDNKRFLPKSKVEIAKDKK